MIDLSPPEIWRETFEDLQWNIILIIGNALFAMVYMMRIAMIAPRVLLFQSSALNVDTSLFAQTTKNCFAANADG